MSPTKFRYIQSRPFKGNDLEHILAVPDPSFQYTPNVMYLACSELLGLCLDLEKYLSSFIPEIFFTTFEYIDILCSATLGCYLCSLFCSAGRWDFRDTNYTLFGLWVRYELITSSTSSALFNLRLCMTDGMTWTVKGTDTLHVYPGNQYKVENWDGPPPDFPPASLGKITGDPKTTALAKE